MSAQWRLATGVERSRAKQAFNLKELGHPGSHRITYHVVETVVSISRCEQTGSDRRTIG
jgi:hypothetical protein